MDETAFGELTVDEDVAMQSLRTLGQSVRMVNDDKLDVAFRALDKAFHVYQDVSDDLFRKVNVDGRS